MKDDKCFFENILITGGLGDFLAVDSFLPNEQKSKIKKIILATKAGNFIKSLFNLKNKYYCNLKKIQILDYNFLKNPAFHSLEITKYYIPLSKKFWENVYDGSISNVFKLIRKKELKYQESSFLKLNINIRKFNLPNNYFTILPCSSNKINDFRNFDDNDWEYLIHFLKMNKKIGICLGTENKKIPKDNYLINLTKETSVLESIEILKKSKGYIGIDSWLSVLSPKIFSKNKIYIKSNSKHCFKFSNIYFKPLVIKSFLFNNLKQLNIKFQKF